MASPVAHTEAPTDDGAVHSQTVIVGAGPAGLAVGACLSEAGISSLILEQSDRVGASWHRHYERLHLHTPKAYSGLPLAPFPASYPRYPSRRQVIEYLEAYARRFRLEPRFGQRVVAVRQVDGGWAVLTPEARYQARNLVIAAGCNREPRLPSWPGQAAFRGRVLHSSEYQNGEPFRNQKVLVVGLGNSGGEIAIDLYEHGAEPGLSVRGPANVVPREILGVPILAFSLAQRRLPPRWADTLNAPLLRLVLGDLTRYGLRRPPRGPVAQVAADGRIPLIDVGTIGLIKRGRISVHPAIERFTPEGVVFSDGTPADFHAVILATGFRPRVDAFLEGAAGICDQEGKPLSSGAETVLPGLFFCGYHVAPTGMLREIGLEARRISAAIRSRMSVSPRMHTDVH